MREGQTDEEGLWADPIRALYRHGHGGRQATEWRCHNLTINRQHPRLRLLRDTSLVLVCGQGRISL
jgi:hypothetical protein